MTQKELDYAISHYQKALVAGRITELEFQGFIEALRQLIIKHLRKEDA